MRVGRCHIRGDGLFLTDLKETWIGPTGSTEYQDRAADHRRVLYEFTDGVLLLNGEAYGKRYGYRAGLMCPGEESPQSAAGADT